MHEDTAKLLAQGAAAEALLADPTFIETIADIKQAYTDILFGSSYAETAKREHAYSMVRALGDIVSLLQARTTAKDQYVLNLEQDETL